MDIIRKTPLLKPEKIGCRSEGELVILTICATDIRMHYEDALKISQWLRLTAKTAKRKAGDDSRHWSVVANMDGI